MNIDIGRLSIKANGLGSTTLQSDSAIVTIDGQRIPGLRALTLRIEAGKPILLTTESFLMGTYYLKQNELNGLDKNKE